MSDHKFFMTRRRFALTTASALGPLSLLAAKDDTANRPWAGPATVRKIYLGGKPSWPRPDVDLTKEIAEIEANLAELERRYPGQIRFTGGEMTKSDAEVGAWLEKDSDADVILAFPVITITLPQIRKLVESGKPVVQFSRPYQGHDWTHGTAYMQKGAKLDLIASSNYADLDGYVPLFRTIHHLRHSKVLLMSQPNARPKAAGGFTEQFGTTFGYPSYLDLNAIYDSVSVEQGRKLADEFIRAAAKVVEPTRDEIVDSMRLYVAMQKMLDQERANAIAIDCLGGFGRKELPAYPCVGFSRLNDAGLYGVCENDLDSTMTQLLVTSFSGRPGFVSDPVFDTSRNEVIHAHCVSATRLKGVDTEPCPYMVRSHLEDHKGVSMQVLAPAGEPVTVAKFIGAKKFMLSTGEALGNVDDERGCRTKIRTRVKDARSLLKSWGAAVNTGPAMPGTRDLLHRVVFYGDHTQSIERLAQLTGFQVTNEG